MGRGVLVALATLGFFFFTNTSIIENVFIQVENKRRKYFKACQLLYKVMAWLEWVEQELASIENNSVWLVRHKQKMLASIECAKRSSIINYKAIIDMFRGLSFNFSSIDLFLEDWSLLLSVPISSPKVAIYSRLNYSWVFKCTYYLYTSST